MLCFSQISVAQYNGNKWCFGDSAGLYFTSSGVTTFDCSLRSKGSCVSICDNNDSLLIYANTRASMSGNTTQVWNRFNTIINNGSNIVGEGWYHELELLPDPANDSLFYLFSIGV